MKSTVSVDMPPDFSREVRCVLGLPFDAMSEAEAEEATRKAVSERRRCFMSTPNLNFAVACLKDSVFRASVLQSDLSLADGWPVVAWARLSQVELPGRVAGSSLFERLRTSNKRPALSVYFFGGPDGAAEQACMQLCAENSGLTGVGFATPGFGSIEEMSTDEHIRSINLAQPDILVLALGAKKGQAWIQHNLARLQVPVVTHLGAVVNFVAGSVKRAPAWVQAVQLEWLWRIVEEPALWRRYSSDGSVFISLLVRRFFTSRKMNPSRHSQLTDPVNMSIRTMEGTLGVTLTLSGSWTDVNLTPLRDEFSKLCCLRKDVCLDMAKVTQLDSAAIALMTLIYGWQLKMKLGWRLTEASVATRIALKIAHAEFLLESSQRA